MRAARDQPDARRVSPATLVVAVCAGACAVTNPRACGQGCELAWSAQFAATERPDPSVLGYRALQWHDDGSGPALYAGGQTLIGPTGNPYYDGVVRWRGDRWEAVGSGPHGSAYALAVFDDGSGPALYAGGSFLPPSGVSAKLAKWNGSEWSHPPGGPPNGLVTALATVPEAGGPALYAGGIFTNVGSAQSPGLGRWDGIQWHPVGGGLTLLSNLGVLALASFDDASGPALYVGGQFSHAGVVPAANVAKWDGSTWSALGGGLTHAIPGLARVHALAAFDDGTGPALYAGGFFKSAGSVPVQHIARWDGRAWSDVGGGFSGGILANDRYVACLSVLDDGTGATLYAGGNFYRTGDGNTILAGIARWRARAWEPVGGGMVALTTNGPSFNAGVYALG